MKLQIILLLLISICYSTINLKADDYIYSVPVNDNCSEVSPKFSKCPGCFDTTFLIGKPVPRENNISKYCSLNNVLFIVNQNNENLHKYEVLVLIVSISENAKIKWVDKNQIRFLSKIYGKKIDIVSGTIKWNHGGKKNEYVFNFNNTPVMEVTDLSIRNSKECSCE